MKWKDILKNIQISGQRTTSADLVPPDEDDETCRDRYMAMLDFIIQEFGEDSVDNYDVALQIPEEILCKALDAINDAPFITHNGPTIYQDSFDFYEATNYKADIKLRLSSDYAMALAFRFVPVASNTIDIYCYYTIGSLYTFQNFTLNGTYRITEQEREFLYNLESYEDGLEVVAVPKGQEPAEIKRIDWRKF